MEHITITISKDGKKAHLVPDEGYMLRRGQSDNLYSDALVKNTPKELRLWSAVAI